VSESLVTKEDAVIAMRVLSALAAAAAVRASEAAIYAAQCDPQQEPRHEHHHRVAGNMMGARDAAERATTYAAAVTFIAREVFP
jgi:hypothetical protein